MTNERIDIALDSVIPSVTAILRAQGVPTEGALSARACNLAEEAIKRYRELARPVGLLKPIARSEFAAVYCGEEENATETPLEAIYHSADQLALFAVTLGESVCREISRLFEKGEFAIGASLDAAASEGAELAAMNVESNFRNRLQTAGLLDSTHEVMRFSPGYCGWHLSGQKRLFESLHPEEIGISLSESCLMYPLKSISGVIVAGARAIYAFEPNYPFCAECRTPTCRERIRILQDR